jgi:hypothetical protein
MLLACHSERSEESHLLYSIILDARILSEAKNDSRGVHVIMLIVISNKE